MESTSAIDYSKSSDYTIVIEPNRTEKHYWSDIWHYRELIYILSWRDLKVRYKQTFLGVAWSVIRPLLTMLIFTFIFGQVAKFPVPGDINYAVMVFAGLIAWQFFASGLSEASNSLVGNERLISKVYFPRMIIPAASIITSLVDFLISLVLMFVLLMWYRIVPSQNIIFLPVFILWTFFCSFGAGVYLTALNVKYRDFKYVVPFVIQLGLYLSPVGFTSDVAAKVIPEKWQLLYYLNPMAGIIDGFRWCFFGGAFEVNFWGLVISFSMTLFFLLLGIRTFRRMERNFADLI